MSDNEEKYFSVCSFDCPTFNKAFRVYKALSVCTSADYDGHWNIGDNSVRYIIAESYKDVEDTINEQHRTDPSGAIWELVGLDVVSPPAEFNFDKYQINVLPEDKVEEITASYLK